MSMNIACTRKRVCLIHANKVSPEFKKYLGLKEIENSMSMDQVARLIRGEALQAQQLKNYSRQIDDIDFLDVISNNDDNLSQENMNIIRDFIINQDIYDYVVIDLDLEFNNPTAKDILKKTNIVILNIGHSLKEADKFKKIEKDFKKMVNNAPILRVVSKYNETAGRLQDFDRYIGNTGIVKTDNILGKLNIQKPISFKIHYNAFLTWGTNNNKLPMVFKNIRNKDNRIVEVSNDLNELMTYIYKNSVVVQRLKNEKRTVVEKSNKKDDSIRKKFFSKKDSTTEEDLKESEELIEDPMDEKEIGGEKLAQ